MALVLPSRHRSREPEVVTGFLAGSRLVAPHEAVQTLQAPCSALCLGPFCPCTQQFASLNSTNERVLFAPEEPRKDSSCLPHARHVFVCFGQPHDWPGSPLSQDWGLMPRCLRAAVHAADTASKTKSVLTVCEGRDDSKAGSYNGDVLLFPECLIFRALTRFDIQCFVEDALVRQPRAGRLKPEALSGCHVFVCCQSTPGTTCGHTGPGVAARLAAELAARGIPESQVRVWRCCHLSSGSARCWGNVVVIGAPGSLQSSAGGAQEVLGGAGASPRPPRSKSEWYSKVTPDDVHELVESHLLGGRVLHRLWVGSMALPAKPPALPPCPAHRPHRNSLSALDDGAPRQASICPKMASQAPKGPRHRAVHSQGASPAGEGAAHPWAGGAVLSPPGPRGAVWVGSREGGQWLVQDPSMSLPPQPPGSSLAGRPRRQSPYSCPSQQVSALILGNSSSASSSAMDASNSFDSRPGEEASWHTMSAGGVRTGPSSEGCTTVLFPTSGYEQPSQRSATPPGQASIDPCCSPGPTSPLVPWEPFLSCGCSAAAGCLCAQDHASSDSSELQNASCAHSSSEDCQPRSWAAQCWLAVWGVQRRPEQHPVLASSVASLSIAVAVAAAVGVGVAVLRSRAASNNG